MTPAPFLYLQRSQLKQYLTRHDGNHASWAFVTGASDGIGQGLAEELAESGFNVILHGRNPKKLDGVQEKLQAEHPDAQFRTVIANAAKFDDSVIQNIAKEVEDLPITILINNVGGTAVLDQNFKTFSAHSPSEINAVISLNLTFTLQLTNALLPILHKQPGSLIMNMGSQAQQGIPFLPVYSATKGAIYSWTRSLCAEQRANKTGTEVMEILIGSVQSQQNKTERPTFFVPSSRDMARAALARVGCGKPSVVGYFPHYLQQLAYFVVPQNLLDGIVAETLRPLAEGKQKTW